MASKVIIDRQGEVGAWAKRCYFAGRAAMEAMLRPFDLGSTQWYILFHLVQEGPTSQRDLVRLMQVERATLSVVVGALVRKGLVNQVTDDSDQRRKLLQLTPAGEALWTTLPDIAAVIDTAAFGGISEIDRKVAVAVLRRATDQLETFFRKGSGT
jgi:DNA-binding MarR family transcriptional regulator